MLCSCFIRISAAEICGGSFLSAIFILLIVTGTVLILVFVLVLILILIHFLVLVLVIHNRNLLNSIAEHPHGSSVPAKSGFILCLEN